MYTNPTYVDAPIKKIYFRMEVVSRFLHEAPSCIRFWARKFKLDHKRGTGGLVGGVGRLFTKEDIGKLKEIRRMVRDEGLTLRGVMKRLKKGYPSFTVFDPAEEDELRKITLPDG